MFTVYYGGISKWLVSKETWDKTEKKLKMTNSFCLCILQPNFSACWPYNKSHFVLVIINMPWHFSIIANASAASTANLLEGYNEDDDGECSGTNFVIAVKPH